MHFARQVTNGFSLVKIQTCVDMSPTNSSVFVVSCETHLWHKHHTSPSPLAELSPDLMWTPCLLQMAAGLSYLHQNHIVHLDVKSGNVLVWRFPSANLALADRAQRASDVDLRLTDYGISRLSGYHGVRLDGPVGTPGYTAPELNHCKGLEISADKVGGVEVAVGRVRVGGGRE